MTDKKLTDSEIFEKLERYKDVSDSDITTTSVDTILLKATYLFINRLQAENERLKNILICFMGALWKVRKLDDIDEISLIPLMSELNKQYRAEIKAEAVKEFADKVKELPYYPSYTNLHKAVDNLLKELVGEDK